MKLHYKGIVRDNGDDGTSWMDVDLENHEYLTEQFYPFEGCTISITIDVDLLESLRRILDAKVGTFWSKIYFTKAFRLSVDYFNLDDEAISSIFKVSITTVKRWRNGFSPTKSMQENVLKYFIERLENV